MKMKIGIVLKLFILTTSLCMLILTTIFIGQTIFFKQYYENQKIDKVNEDIQSFQEEYLKAGEDVATIQRLEQDFYQENSTWITSVDHAGTIKYANDFSVKIELEPSSNQEFSNRVMNIPLYSLIDIEEIERATFDLEQGNRIFIDGIKKDDIVVPAILTVENKKNKRVVFENRQLSEKLYGKTELTDSTLIGNSPIYVIGNIKELHLPVSTVSSNVYTNPVFMERLKQFQVNLLLNQYDISHVETDDYKENNIHYKIFIRPLIDSTGKPIYIFAMTSLQPVDEAVQMLKDYYVYLLLLVLLLSLLASFYYSKKIAKPLLQINETTNKMANLDFSETIPITSNDEIGELSQNINTLSSTLHSYIHQLLQDIEKEKQLEHTRKEFISGVSHELKTPLSIMKSCISILEDGVASDKKEHYFKALAKEVDNMDRLIVDMLELAKMESGTYKMEMGTFYINRIIENICKQLALDIADKKLHVHQQLSESKVVANQHRIEQVITNFMTNAIRYTPENNSILITTIEEQERVKVCVENKGAHIAEEQVEKIWDRFYRGDMSRHRSKGGTGLGLAISKKILELHGAEYGVVNTEDGVLFYFYLNKKG